MPSPSIDGRNGAIGGVVDVHTGRIPHNVPERFEARAEARPADNANLNTFAGLIKTGTGGMAFHLDGFHSEVTRCVIAIMSVVQPIFLTETGVVLMKTKLRIQVWHLAVIFLLRTILAFPLAVLAAHLLVWPNDKLHPRPVL